MLIMINTAYQGRNLSPQKSMSSAVTLCLCLYYTCQMGVKLDQGLTEPQFPHLSKGDDNSFYLEGYCKNSKTK